MSSYYHAPWGDVRASAVYLETHAARCRVLDLPYTAQPVNVHAALRAAPEDVRELAEVEIAEAQANLDGMFSWRPPGAEDHSDDVFGLFATSHHEHFAAYGGRGGAKSWDAVDTCIEAASTGYERVAGAREYMTRTSESSKELFDKRVKQSKWAEDWEITNYRLYNKKTKSVIFFIGLAGHNAESVGKSLEGITILWCDEAQLLSQTSIDIMLPTIRASNSRCIWTWNPGEDPSPVDDLFRGGTRPERTLILYRPVEDNPYLYRTRLGSEMRSAYKREKPSKFQHIWRGGHLEDPETAIFTDVVVGDMNMDLYLKRDGVHELAGMDFGYGGSDPSAVVRAYLIQPSAQPNFSLEAGMKPIIYVADEAVQQAVPNHELHLLCEEAVVTTEVKCDSAMPLMIAALNASGQVFATPAAKGPGSVVSGLRKLSSCHIIVSPRAPITYESLKGLRWETDSKTKKIKVPRKPVGEKHTPDALRYALTDVELEFDVVDDVDYL